MSWLFEHLGPIFSWFKEPIIALICLSVLVFVHELGHFLVAKWCGVGVVKFAVGFGPAILKFRRKETDYQVGCIPLGGFVRMVGDMPDSLTGEQETDKAVLSESDENKEEENEKLSEAFADRSRWFIEKSLWQRSAIVFAGPLFNFIFAMFVVAFAVFAFGRIDTSAKIGIVREGAPADIAGIKVGDKIISIENKAVEGWKQMALSIGASKGEAIHLQIKRGEQLLDLAPTPKLAERMGATGEKEEFYAIGIGPALEYPGVFSSFYSGVIWTGRTTALTYAGLWSILSGEISAKDGIAGPIKIYQVAKYHAKRGFKEYLFFMAFVSVSLAAINLVPIPVLDGGHLFFFLIEGLFGPISMRKKEMAQQFGLLLILLLMVFAVHNDLTSDPLKEPTEELIEWKDDESKKKSAGVENTEPNPLSNSSSKTDELNNSSN